MILACNVLIKLNPRMILIVNDVCIIMQVQHIVTFYVLTLDTFCSLDQRQ